MSASETTSLLLSLTNMDETVVFDMGEFSGGAVQASLRDASMTWGSAVVNIERSLDGSVYYPLEPDAIQFTAENMSWRLEFSGVSKIRARVTTIATVGFPVAVVTFHGIRPIST